MDQTRRKFDDGYAGSTSKKRYIRSGNPRRSTSSSSRSRSRSISPWRSAKRKKNYSESSRSPMKFRKVEDYRHELSRFLEESVNIKHCSDFWKFYEKYQNAQQLKSRDNTYNRNSLVNIDFEEINKNSLLEKIPTLDRNGEKVNISSESLDEFLIGIKIYQDFQQKMKFAKLKKIRTAQKDLPIAQYKDEIITKLSSARVMLIAGNTGCGKSTQVPQYVIDAGYKKIVCTQPRRIACVSLAKRVAYETLTEFKNTVGYQIRFEKTKRKDTKIIFMTEGLLLRQASEEDTLNSYDVIILDEVHERHLHGDFLIGIMKCLLYKRTDIKLILMSATINIELFSQYFADENIEVIQVPGRLYPIEIHYRPIVKDPYERKTSKFNCTPYLQILQMIDEKYKPQQKGDVLIFLNGYSEISTLADAVSEYAEQKKNWIVLPLHSSLSLEEQDKVFDYPPEGVRKCIISTNIAETSVTIDGIRFVIDSGKVNKMFYNTNAGVNKLTESNISQDSAKQRCGRAGRTGPGTCYRIYSEEDFKNFEAFTPAEIHLVPLDSLILHMVSLGLSDIENFPFLEKPSQKAIEESLEKLKFTGALALQDQVLALTPLGDALSQLPVDLSIGKMLIMSTIFGNVNSVLALSALLSVQSPLTQNAYKDSEAQNLRKPLESNHGEPMTLLSFYKEWLTVKQYSAPVQSGSRQKSQNSRAWSKKRCLEEQRFYEATKLLEQFRDILNEANLLPKIENEQLSSGERAMRHGELKHLKNLRNDLKNASKSNHRKQLKFELYNTGEDASKSEPSNDIRDVEFRISNDFKRLQKLLNEASADSFKALTLLKLILTSGFYPQIAVEDEHNTSKTVSERLYHTKNKNYVFLRPMSYFATNPEVLELHNDDIEVPPPGYFSKRPISKKHQILVFQSILETKKVYLVNTMRMPCIQTLFLFGKTICTNSTLTKFVVDDFLAIDAPYFGQAKHLLLRAIELRKKWKDKLDKKLNNPMSKQSPIDKEEMFYFAEDLVNFLTLEVSYNLKRLLPADLRDLYTNCCENFDGIDAKRNPFDKDFSVVKNFHRGGFNVTENVIFDCLEEEEWSLNLQTEVFCAEHNCRHCHKSLSETSMFKVMQHEEFCENKTGAVTLTSEQSKAIVVKPNSKSWHCDKCNKDLVLTPVDILRHKKSCVNKESAAVQMLLETCMETEDDRTEPGRRWALQEVRSLVCSYLHQVFIAETMLAKLVHFQGYPSELLEVVVKGVPSMHICLDFLQELMQQPSLKKQIFAVQLLSHLSVQYALPKSLNLCVTALNLLYALLGGISSSQRVKLFKPVLPALVKISEAFPPLVEDIVNLLMQLARICESQASLASHFDSQRGTGLEISAQESAELCQLTKKTFADILDKAVLRNNIYRQQ